MEHQFYRVEWLAVCQLAYDKQKKMSKVLYNVTVKISHEVHDEWLKWMLDVHIPEVMKLGKFHSYRLQRIIGDDTEDGQSYAIGYVAGSMAEIHTYQVRHATTLQEAHQKKYNGHYAAFRTLMEIKSEG